MDRTRAVPHLREPKGPRDSREDLVLIRTLPLRRGNYGGVLQTYALQAALAGLGYEAHTDTSERRSVRSRLKHEPIDLFARLTGKPVGFFARQRALNRKVNDFVDQHVATVRIFGRGNRTAARRVARYGALVAGSDQVWRAKYGDWQSYMYDFVPAKASQIRVAYAASFGSDRPDVEQQLFRKHLVSFDAVSYREESGARFHEWLTGESVQTMPDPTLLLDPEHYEELAGTASGGGRASTGARSGEQVLVYVLDRRPVLVAGVERFAENTGSTLSHQHGAEPDPERAGGGAGLERPGVVDWLKGFIDAGSVITDSFHGTVFAIIFGKPFVAVANVDRGVARFESLLGAFGLRDRLVLAEDGEAADSVAETIHTILAREIDWDVVAAKRESLREEGLRFLHGSLSGRVRRS